MSTNSTTKPTALRGVIYASDIVTLWGCHINTAYKKMAQIREEKGLEKGSEITIDSFLSVFDTFSRETVERVLL